MKLVPPPSLSKEVHAASQRLAEALKGEAHEVCILALATVAGVFVGGYGDPGTAAENFMRAFGDSVSGASKEFGHGEFRMQMLVRHDGGKA